ncbi:MAG: hypothetical protein JRJ65_15000 [Deltaproteobacteria bacterium]|nr:hypothetical protein [Deltaproteobacteria bacterium]
MGTIYILVSRLILSIILASVISHIFFNGVQVAKTGGLAAVMFVLSYLFEFTRKRDKRDGGKD